MRCFIALAPLVMLGMILSGCGAPSLSSERRDASLGPAAPLTADQPAPPATRSAAEGRREAAATRPAFKAPRGTLRLADALAAALRHNPALKAFSAEVRAREARALQEGLLPNPKLELEAEEVGRRGSAIEDMETVVRLKQPILTAGKLAKRTRVAELEGDLARWDYRSKRLDVFTKVVKRFVSVLEAQRRVGVARRAHKLAERVHGTVKQQVEAGEVRPVAGTRAKVERANARMALRDAKRARDSARQALARAWAGSKARFERAEGQLAEVAAPPARERLVSRVAQNPDVRRWKTELAQRRARTDLAEARAMPNLTAMAGFQHFGGTADPAGQFGVSAPLPIFDRNQGRVAAAQARVVKAAHRRRAARVNARSRLKQAHTELTAAYREVRDLKENVLPGARSAHESIRKAYEAGQTDLLEVLDAQRTRFEAERRLVRARARYHAHAATVERLIAQSLDSISEDKRRKGRAEKDGAPRARE